MKRDLYWDSLKFILIFLVVYGHIAPHYLGGGPFNMAIYNLVYLFHMPLFIFVSGRFSHIHDRHRYKRGILLLLESYLVFQAIRSSVPLLHGESLWRCLIIPRWTLWYLVALIYWRLMLLFIPPRWLQHRAWVIGVSVFLSLAVGFVPLSKPFVFQRAFSLLPFFVLGYYSVDVDVRKAIDRIPPVVAAAVLLGAFCVLYFVLNRSLTLVHDGSYPYWSSDASRTMLRFAGRCVFIPASLVLGAMVMRLVPTHATLARWGRLTLFIYLYHTFAINVLDALVARGYLPQNEVLLIAYAALITLGLVLLSRVKALNVLMNPVSTLVGRGK